MTLAVAVGVNLVVFTVVNALWLRPLPVRDADHVVALPASALTTLESPGLDIFRGAVAGQVITDDRFGSQFLQPHIRFDHIARDLETLSVTSGYFRLFGLNILGRDFRREDTLTGAEPVAIISNRLWSSEFGGRSDVIGAVIPARPLPVRVIGVAPAGFEGARRGEKADVWIPSGLVPQVVRGEVEWSLPLMVFARLPPGQTAADVNRRLGEKYANDPVKSQLTVVPLKHVFGTPDTPTIVIREGNAAAIVGGLALLVLLGGCATLAALVLVHLERRRVEIAVRNALGASPLRLIAQFAGELAWVASSGIGGAVIVAVLCLRAIPALSLPGGVDLGRLDLSIDWRVLTAGIGATAVILVTAAGWPVIRVTRKSRASELSASAATSSAKSQRLRQTLLALHVSATIIVLIAAGLFVRAVVHGFGNAPGFDVDRTVFITIQLLSTRAEPSDGWREAVVDRTSRIRDALRSLPAVDAVADLDGYAPVGSDALALVSSAVLVKVRDEQYALSLGRVHGSPELLSTLAVPIVAGRALTVGDATAVPVPAVLTASLARRLWPSESPLGQAMWTNLRDGRFIIVGIARDFVFGSLARPAAGVVVTAHRAPLSIRPRFVVHTARPYALVHSIRHLLETVVPNAPWLHVEAGRDLIARDLGRQRLGAWFFSGFGLASLILGVGGVFGLVAYLAESRQREFGVRLALGATTAHLIRHGLAAALVPVFIGVSAGLLCAACVSRLFTSLLTGLSAVDVLTYVAVATIMVGCATVAALWAAWRLRRTTPSDALRMY